MASHSSDHMLRRFFLGFIRIHILHHAAKEAVCGVDLSAELKRHGYDLSPGTLYPVLHGLHGDGYLSCIDLTQDGRRRRSYRITASGRKALHRAKQQISELVEELLENEKT